MSNKRLLKVGDIAFIDSTKSGKSINGKRQHGQAVLCLGLSNSYDRHHQNPDIINFYCPKTHEIFMWFCSWMNDA